MLTHLTQLLVRWMLDVDYTEGTKDKVKRLNGASKLVNHPLFGI